MLFVGLDLIFGVSLTIGRLLVILIELSIKKYFKKTIFFS